MATGHPDPGYADIISKFRRAKSAGFPLDKETMVKLAQQNVLQADELDSIKKKGTALWLSYPQKMETSYDSHYCARPADEKALICPSSPNRRNRPHPAQVFLVSRLHHIPGYHNADTTIGKEAYRVDASLPVDIREQRMAVRHKYRGPYSGTWANSFKDPNGLTEQLGGRSGHAAEAWLKIADEKDHEKVFNAIHKDEENERKQGLSDNGRSKTAYPSLTRWMRFAGERETGVFNDVARSLGEQRDQGYKSPLTPNPFHGRPIMSSISSTRSPTNLIPPPHIRYQTGRPLTRGDF